MLCTIVIPASIRRYQLVRTRVIQLVDNWIGIKMSPEFRPSLYQTYIQLLDPSEPLLVSFVSPPSNALDRSHTYIALRLQFAIPSVSMKRGSREAGCCGGLWLSGSGSYSQTPWVQVPQLPVLSLFSFLSKQVVFHTVIHWNPSIANL